MDKVSKHELIFIKYYKYLLVSTFVYILLNYYLALNMIDTRHIFFDVVFFLFMGIITFIKYLTVIKGYFEKSSIFNLFRVVELSALVLGMRHLESYKWSYILLFFLILLTSISNGGKYGSLLVGFCFLFYISTLTVHVFVFDAFDIKIFYNNIMINTYFFIILSIFAMQCGEFHNDMVANENERNRLLKELEDKYAQLAAAQNEIKHHYDKLKENNIVLENTNVKLTASIGEFYTLHHISQAISSILDIKELLRYVNDVILGVMGVNFSTIFLIDEKTQKLKVHTTNITSLEERAVLGENVNSCILLQALERGEPIMENCVDNNKYLFTMGRDIGSLICVPLSTKTKKFGLVLIEQKYCNAFDDNNVRLLDIIGQQVGIALENAELYQKMHEMATIDGLTGVFNRLYFQHRLKEEFDNAKKGGYDLSLGIFDIDHFKRFNDTYGHLFGDEVLKSLAKLVKNTLKCTDVFARYGGEEFIILFPRTSMAEACVKVENLRIMISEIIIKDDLVSASVTASFGVAGYPEAAKNENELIRMADDALYEAKASGRNCVRLAKTAL